MKAPRPAVTRLEDYRPPPFAIAATELRFDLHEDHALVESRLRLERAGARDAPPPDALTLHGRGLVLEELRLNGEALAPGDFRADGETLEIPSLSARLGGPPERFTVECRTRIEPQNNTALEGLYRSRGMFCTQCEAEGFRRITYYLDRPDVMSAFTTTIEADRARYPVLLSNGDRIAAGPVEGAPGRHRATWRDPFKKPSYLFALVACDLGCLEDRFATMSGREVALKIFAEPKHLDKCRHAMASLKKAMRWDEEVYGREYDLDTFMIVAVDDFNMGAMENKGLNIFNTACVLACPDTATDEAFQRVEGVVAHEYFHNWSGNRVTCRDWFQLSLKEGFTVFRDAEFSADMGSRAVKRVLDASFLQSMQFPEDSGPMAHPVRPDSYMEISNFYTFTVYEKGAELVRMIRLILGPEDFRRGADLYFERHDGQAVTIEDFIRAMEEAGGADLGRFRRWYRQAGTPELKVSGEYDAARRRYRLRVRQSCPPTPGQESKEPFHIPLRMGLLGPDGAALPLRLAGEEARAADERVLHVTERERTFEFVDVEAAPVPSLLRGFSAPVRLEFAHTRDELRFLMARDSDGFSRWSAAQTLAADALEEMRRALAAGGPARLPEILAEAFADVLDAALADPERDRAMTALLLELPGEGRLIEEAGVAEPDLIHRAREAAADALALGLEDRFAAARTACRRGRGAFRADAAGIARRALANRALRYLSRTGKERWLERCFRQFEEADNMSDRMAALACLADSPAAAARPLEARALEAFHARWRDEPLALDQWFAVQALCPRPGAVRRVRELLRHPDFTLKNPNRVRSLLGAFSLRNHAGFHEAGGYELLADQALALDPLNPQIAARLLMPLTRWRKFEPERSRAMKAQLERARAAPKLSRDAFEVAEKGLA